MEKVSGPSKVSHRLTCVRCVSATAKQPKAPPVGQSRRPSLSSAMENSQEAGWSDLGLVPYRRSHSACRIEQANAKEVAGYSSTALAVRGSSAIGALRRHGNI